MVFEDFFSFDEVGKSAAISFMVLCVCFNMLASICFYLYCKSSSDRLLGLNAA